jgi:hypothetical protein
VNKLFIILLALFSFGAMASSTRSVDADSITSSDKTKTYTLPSSSGSLVISGQVPIGGQLIRDPYSGNGSTTAFTLSQAPFNTGHVQVFQDGLLLTITTDYTISGTTLTMITAPVLGQTLLVIYSRY